MKKKQTYVLMFMCILVCVLFFANAANAYAAKTYINKVTAYLVEGESVPLKVIGTSSKVTWTSANRKVATVTSTGTVKAVSTGNVTISASFNKSTFKYKITVLDPSSFSLKPTSTTIMVGDIAVSLNPKGSGYSATDINNLGITYTVSGNTGVNVSKTGKVTASKGGSFKVSAYIHGKKFATVSMKAVAFNGFEVSEVKVDTGQYIKVSFADGFKAFDDVYVDTDDVIAISANPEIATVELAYDTYDLNHYTGILITGVKDAKTTISVTFKGVTKTIKVTSGEGWGLDPIDAVKANDFTGYSGYPLATLKEVRRIIDENNLMSTSLSDKDKIMAIQNVLTSNRVGIVGDFSGGISEVILYGTGVCSHYANTVSFFCDCIGIPCYLVFGQADIGEAEWYPHEWNKVKVDGTWYYLDAFWNVCLENYDYYLTETLWPDHVLDNPKTHEYVEATYAEVYGCNGVPYANEIK